MEEIILQSISLHKNAMSFQKGQSGNPKGTKVAPKELRFESALKRILSQGVNAATIGEYEEAITRMDKLAERIVHIAETSQNDRVALHAFQIIADRIDGKPKHSVQLSEVESHHEMSQYTNEELNQIIIDGYKDLIASKGNIFES